MGTIERRHRQKESLRLEILAAAGELFAKEGYESVSMRRIAEKIEYSPTTIYLYFRDKRELVDEICNQTFALLAKKLEKVVEAVGDPVERLRAGLKAYIDFGLKHPDQYRVAFMTPCDAVCDGVIKTHTQGGRAFQYLTQSVAQCIEAGRFRETDVLAVSQSLWLIIHGVTALKITHGTALPWVDHERLVDLTLDVAIRGLLK